MSKLKAHNRIKAAINASLHMRWLLEHMTEEQIDHLYNVAQQKETKPMTDFIRQMFNQHENALKVFFKEQTEITEEMVSIDLNLNK